MQNLSRLAQLLFLIAATLFATSAVADTNRVALLIGNKDYNAKVGTLSNPLNDVAIVERALTQIGFKVTKLENLDYRAMDTAIRKYTAEVSELKGDTISFFYYSGHGASNSRTGTNYLIPIDVANADDDGLWSNSVNQSEIIERLTRNSGNAFHYVVFDACRDQLRLASTQKSLGSSDKGFVPVLSTGGILIAYATAPGRSASDTGSGAGPYARALAAELLSKKNANAFSMFGAIARRVSDETGRKQDPWFSASPMPEFADRLAATIIPPPPPRPEKQKPDLPEFAEIVVSDVDYLPDLRGGIFGGRNSIGLVFENEGRQNSATLGVGSTSRSAAMTYAPAEEFAFQLIEYGTLQTFEITNVQTMKASELGQSKRLTFRIRETTFSGNPNIDKQRKTVSLTVRLLAFDPEKSSGDDASEAGARTFGPGQPFADTVSFQGQDATDYVRLAAGKGTCVIRFPTRDTFDRASQGVVLDVRNAQSKFDAVKQLSDTRIWTAPCDAASSTIFRIIAEPLNGYGRYQIAIVQDGWRAADYASLMETMLSDYGGSDSPNDQKGQTQQQFIRSIGELRRHLGVDDAPRLLKQLEQFLLKRSTSYGSGGSSRLVAELIDSESSFYRAADDSPVLRVHMALYRGENGKPYDRAVVLSAIQSGDLSIAERAVRIIGKVKDPAFVRTTLTPLLLDPRESIARAAREAILALDKPAPPQQQPDRP